MADLGELVGGLMKDPSLIGGLLSSLTQTKTEDLPSAVPHPEEGAVGAASVGRAPASRREALLSGLKPYLKESTCTRLDAALLLVGALESLGISDKPEQGGQNVPERR